MPAQVLQANLNYASRAQDLFLQTLGERSCGLGIAAEPYNPSRNHPKWAVDRLGSVAITWREAPDSPLAARRLGREGFVAVEWGRVVVVGVYLPPSLTLSQFEDKLEGVGKCVRALLPAPVVVAEDFNAKSAMWGSRRSDRGKGPVLELWAAGLRLCLMNTGTTLTKADGGSSLI